jgi:hypothetical protein
VIRDKIKRIPENKLKSNLMLDKKSIIELERINVEIFDSGYGMINITGKNMCITIENTKGMAIMIYLIAF